MNTIGIRLVTDGPFYNRQWTNNWQQHTYELILNLIFSFIILAFLYKRLEKKINQVDLPAPAWKEYVYLVLFLFICVTFTTYITHYILDVPDRFEDYVISNVVCIIISLFLYAFIRTQVLQEEYDKKILQYEKIKRKQVETELDFLKAQYHPHFLFNALNTIYFQIDDSNLKAKETIELLADLLRYQLYDISQPVRVKQEIEFMEKYIRFQQLRRSHQATISMNIEDGLEDLMIHPLLYQPLLENAFKYVNGDNQIQINMFQLKNEIVFQIENSFFPVQNEPSYKPNRAGIGLENLKRRLAIIYENRHQLTIEKRKDSFFVELILKPE